MKILIALGLLSIVVALAFAGWAMLNDGRNDERKTSRMANALALRVALSVALFLFILFSYMMGWIQPTGIPVGR